MNDAISNTFFLKLDIIDSKKSKSFSKDLFSQKLGQTALFNSSLHKNKLPSIKKNKFNNISMFPKNNSNIYLSSDNENDLSNILNKLNIPYVPQKRSFWSNENNKQPLLKNISLLNDFSFKERYSKKELKEMLDLKQKQIHIEKKSDKKIDKDNLFNYKEKESNYSKNKENSNKKNKIKIIDAISHVNIQKNLVKKENSKEILGYEPKAIKAINIKNNKYRNKSQEKISILSIKINNDKLDKESILFLKNFYDDFIEVFNSYDKEKNISTINNFNQIYFFLFDIKSFPKSTMNIQFLNSFKYSSILIICLIFLAKDQNLYKDTVQKIKENLEIFILLSLNSINYKILESQKINNFIENTKIKIEEKSLIDTLNNIISILFNDKMNDYKKLRKCLKQMANNINKDSPEKILNIVNDTILFCHNCSYYIEENEYQKKKKSKKNNKNIKEEKKDINKNDDNLSNSIIQEPFIKNKMNKKFCLVIDLDETLIHNLNLPFGDYFFVRPGVFDFFEEIHDIFEIIVFTAGQKNYAYSIIDKIDYKNYISYILYKKHIIYEDGNAIKKLDMIGRDLNKIVFVDNLENNAKYNKKNLYLISSWFNNIYDNQICKLKEKLLNIANSGKYDDDITKGLNQN